MPNETLDLVDAEIKAARSLADDWRGFELL